MAVDLADTAPRTARVFLSYKRNVESDGALADQVVAALSAAGHRDLHRQAAARRPGLGGRNRPAGPPVGLPDRVPDRRVDPERDGPRRDRDRRATRRQRPRRRASCRCASASMARCRTRSTRISTRSSTPSGPARRTRRGCSASCSTRSAATRHWRRDRRARRSRRRVHLPPLYAAPLPRARCPSQEARSTSTIRGICRGRPTPRRWRTYASRARR